MIDEIFKREKKADRGRRREILADRLVPPVRPPGCSAHALLDTKAAEIAKIIQILTTGLHSSLIIC